MADSRTCLPDEPLSLREISESDQANRGAKQKYILISPWPVRPGTGVNNVILGIRDALQRYYDPVIVSTGWTPAPPEEQLWFKLHTPTMPLKNLMAFALLFIPNLFRLHRIIEGAAAVNPHYVGFQHLPLAVLRRLNMCPPLILSFHGADVDRALMSRGIQRAIYRWLLSSADVTVACSNALAVKVKTISPRARVTAILNGITPAPPRRTQRPMAGPYIVSVAALVKKKAHDVLLRAFQRVAEMHPELTLVLLAGAGPEQQAVTALTQTLNLGDRVRLYIDLPYEQVWDWLHHTECFVLASRDEPFGLAVLEAAKACAPVVATRVGGIPEFLDDGVHGLLCEADQPDQLAEAILKTLSDPVAARARAEAFQRHAEQFTWEAVARRYREAAHLP
ncbi:MAG: glycosyltransferase family 4 protein [Acidobacteriaceae bacterium]|nr:glycosyltransferase family 4 protein [Acidobacteriaceae bacterium]